jgi:phosphoglycolate phosphatase-like HAD superfamily hydrolase
VYVATLRDEILQPARGRYGLMPGVSPLLEALGPRESVHLALLTGNFERSAYVKLGHFGIDRFFPWGAFGEESADRDELARVARRRAAERAVPDTAIERAVVIGDTPHDISCARAINARVIAVATGNFDQAALRDAGADVTLADLSDTERVVSLIMAI